MQGSDNNMREDGLPEDFYRPESELAIRLVKASQGISEEQQEVPPEPLVNEAREDIALRLWGCLAGLARANTIPKGLDRCRFGMSDALDELRGGMLYRLALPDKDYSVSLVGELLNKFFGWLCEDRNGTYPAPWGVMQCDGRYLEFSEVRIPQFLPAGDYQKAENMLRQKDLTRELVYSDGEGLAS
jgi:hypothetical protein